MVVSLFEIWAALGRVLLPVQGLAESGDVSTPPSSEEAPSSGEVPSSEETIAIRARSFGAIAREYDRVRPSYPDALVDDVVALLPGTAVVESGAGTGKATVLFAARRVRMSCVEPDPRMAAVLSENCRDFPNVSVTVSAIEDFEATGPFDGLIAAQSWHFTDPARRWVKAASLLREGGLLALFWNRTQEHLSPLVPAITEIYRRHEIFVSNEDADKGPPAWPRDEMETQETFTDVEVRAYYSVHIYSTQEWCDFLASSSHLLVLEPARRKAVLADVAQVIDEAGGVLEEHRRCDLYLARRRDLPV
jgi:SAM-dependent methyltransferase